MWHGTRAVFDQTATETVWITEVEKNKMYGTLAERHGALCRSFLKLKERDRWTSLKMGITAELQTLGAKITSPLMGISLKRSRRKQMMRRKG